MDLPLKLSDANLLYMDNAHYFGLIVLILFGREGVKKEILHVIMSQANKYDFKNCISIARILNVFYLKEFLLIKQSTCSRFSYL